MPVLLIALLLIARAAYGAAGFLAAFWASVYQPSSLSLIQALAGRNSLFLYVLYTE